MDRFPRLYTKRLILRKIEIEDVDSLVKYANNPKISDNIINIPYPYREPDAVFRISYVVQGFKKKVRYVFSIILKESEEFIGEISLHLHGEGAELGYWIGEPFWNQGIITEAAQIVIQFGFEQLHVTNIHATCHVENKASQKVLLNNGISRHHINGNVICYELSREEYEQKDKS